MDMYERLECTCRPWGDSFVRVSEKDVKHICKGKHAHTPSALSGPRWWIGICGRVVVYTCALMGVVIYLHGRGSSREGTDDVHHHRLLRADGNSNLTTSDAPSEAEARKPSCVCLSIPEAAGVLAGTYNFEGRFNNNRPIYFSTDGINLIFAQGTEVLWHLTSRSSSFFMSLDSNASEPAEFGGRQSWRRENDPTCPSRGTCQVEFFISCLVWADELTEESSTSAEDPLPYDDDSNSTWSSSSGFEGNETEASSSSSSRPADNDSYWSPHPTPAPSSSLNMFPTAAPTAAAPIFAPTPGPTPVPIAAAASGPSSPPTPAPTMDPVLFAPTVAPSSATKEEPCRVITVRNGGDRSGHYVLGEAAADPPSSRPTYHAVYNRTDRVFPQAVSVCDPGWGVVNATWLERQQELGPTSSARDVLLHYLARLDLPASGCTMNAWYIANGEATDLASATGETFFALSDDPDPSGATSWAEFTPGVGNSSASLRGNSSAEVICADW